MDCCFFRFFSFQIVNIRGISFGTTNVIEIKTEDTNAVGETN